MNAQFYFNARSFSHTLTVSFPPQESLHPPPFLSSLRQAQSQKMVICMSLRTTSLCFLLNHPLGPPTTFSYLTLIVYPFPAAVLRSDVKCRLFLLNFLYTGRRTLTQCSNGTAAAWCPSRWIQEWCHMLQNQLVKPIGRALRQHLEALL